MAFKTIRATHNNTQHNDTYATVLEDINMNTNNNNTTGYTRKIGFFGSVKQLGVTTVSGLNTATIDLVNTATGITGSTAVVSGLIREATTIWGETLLSDLRADQAEDLIHRELGMLQRTAELDMLKAELTKARTKAKKTTQQASA